MLRKILGTAGTRLFTSIISFIVVIINARALGSEGVGEIALIVLGITIIMLISNFIGGGALVYLIPRHNTFQLFLPSYIWAFISASAGTYLLNLFNLIPEKFVIHIFALSFIQALGSINMTFLLGKERIKEYNFISIIRFAVLISAMLIFFYVAGRKETISYVYSLYFAFSLTFIISLSMTVKYVKSISLKGIGSVLRHILKYGSYVQFANLIQLMNYRISYYIIESYIGKAGLGIFDVGNKMSEGIWLVGKSVSMVQYSKISNTKSEKYSVELTVRFLKFVFAATLFALIVLLLLPESFFGFVFGKDFDNLHLIIQSLSAGIMAMSLSMILSHYFSGVGKHYHNTISSAIGLIFTLTVGFSLIPKTGIVGAGITASISYTASMLYQMTVFFKLTKVDAKMLTINKDDVLYLKKEFKELKKRK